MLSFTPTKRERGGGLSHAKGGGGITSFGVVFTW